jgi:hypothetical protein
MTGLGGVAESVFWQALSVNNMAPEKAHEIPLRIALRMN